MIQCITEILDIFQKFYVFLRFSAFSHMILCISEILDIFPHGKSQKYIESFGKMSRISEIHRILWENVKNLRMHSIMLENVQNLWNTKNLVGRCSEPMKYIESCGKMSKIPEVHIILRKNVQNLSNILNHVGKWSKS
jgi:hypothetical protein